MRVTHILQYCGLREWPASISQADRQWYMERGTAVHAGTELMDRNKLDLRTVDKRIEPYLKAYATFRLEIGGVMLAIEQNVKHPILGYTGRLDRRIGPCRVCRVPCVLDIKTNAADVATRLQLSGYRATLPNGKAYKRMAVSLFETGKYKVEVFDNDARDDAAWFACVQLAAWKLENGYKEEKAE
jgi:hypothetical protein